MLPPFEIDRARTPASVRQAPAGRANEHAAPRELNSLPRAAGTGTDSRLPRCRFTNDRRPRLLTLPSIVRPPLSFISPSSRHSLLCGPVRPPGGRYLSGAGSLRSAPVGRANMLPNCGSTRCPRAAGSETDSRLPRWRFTNDRRPRLLTLPSIVRPPLSRFHCLLVISSFVVLSSRPAAGTSVAPVRFDRHLSGARTTCCPTAAQLAACAQRAAEPTAGCLGGASPTTADRGS